MVSCIGHLSQIGPGEGISLLHSNSFVHSLQVPFLGSPRLLRHSDKLYLNVFGSCDLNPMSASRGFKSYYFKGSCFMLFVLQLA